ncbi:hypothetical protein BDV32DRAFT_131358 [Aspergillus pseudonomiae]|nr:hypothetical protein BDV32DRAFT_131358 [Aspergillus pseudonomiae]
MMLFHQHTVFPNGFVQLGGVLSSLIREYNRAPRSPDLFSFYARCSVAWKSGKKKRCNPNGAC